MKIRPLLSYLRVIYLPFFTFTLLKMAKSNLDKYRLAEIAQLSSRVVILSHYFGRTYEEVWVSCSYVAPIQYPRQPLVHRQISKDENKVTWSNAALIQKITLLKI